MPGNVPNASPTELMPFALAKLFRRQQVYAVLRNEYLDGEPQIGALTDTSRKAWELTVRVPRAEIAAFRAFYTARRGPLEPFYFYDLSETSPPFTYDETGSSVSGRYTVRFDGPWDQTLDVGLGEFSLRLIEVN